MGVVFCRRLERPSMPRDRSVVRLCHGSFPSLDPDAQVMGASPSEDPGGRCKGNLPHPQRLCRSKITLKLRTILTLRSKKKEFKLGTRRRTPFMSPWGPGLRGKGGPHFLLSSQIRA